jgi:hypothetical protein
MAVLKKYVRNHAPPEGSIASGYGIEEIIEFMLTLLLTLNRLGFLNRNMRGEYVERAH